MNVRENCVCFDVIYTCNDEGGKAKIEGKIGWLENVRHSVRWVFDCTERLNC